MSSMEQCNLIDRIPTLDSGHCIILVERLLLDDECLQPDQGNMNYLTDLIT